MFVIKKIKILLIALFLDIKKSNKKKLINKIFKTYINPKDRN